MPPRRKPKTLEHADSESSDSSSGLTPARYLSLQLATALARPADYAAACAELAILLRAFKGQQHQRGADKKAVLELVVADVGAAIANCDGRPASRQALAAVMEAVDRCMPQARRQALARECRAVGVALSRRRRGGLADEEEDQEEEAQCFGNLPTEVVEAVLQQLDPLTLAAAACVSREWRHLACDERLWQPLLERTFGSRATSATSPRAQFAVAAARFPAALLQWRTNRVEHLRGRRLGWLDRSRPPPLSSIRHLTPAQAVCRVLGGVSSGSSSDEAGDSEGEGGDGAALGGRFRFWRL